MKLAIQAYRNETISFENAAKRYGVKITTLKDYKFNKLCFLFNCFT